jgi:hypothetical protein
VRLVNGLVRVDLDDAYDEIAERASASSRQGRASK